MFLLLGQVTEPGTRPVSLKVSLKPFMSIKLNILGRGSVKCYFDNTILTHKERVLKLLCLTLVCFLVCFNLSLHSYL